MGTVLKANFEWTDGTGDLLARVNLQKNGLVQKVIDNAVIRYCMPYVPFKSGTLAQSAYSASKVGEGEVSWETPYARYLYFGEVYGPNIPVFEDDSGIPTRFFSPKGQKKHPTGRQLQYDTSTNPQAGSHWFDRMKADHMQDILREAKNAAGIK